MRTILNDMANFYFDFFNNGEFDEDSAKKTLVNLNSLDKRIGYIEEIYIDILESDCINDVSKIFIKSRKSYFEVAKYYNNMFRAEIESCKAAELAGDKPSIIKREKSDNLVKADIAYTNKKLNSVMKFVDKDGESKDIFYVLTRENISDNTWNIIKEHLEKLKVMCNGNLINKDNFWLNVPVKGFNKELSEEDFKALLDLIRPYFSSEKSIAQLKLNKMKKEVGYLNYILKENIDLEGIDKSRREFLLRLLDKNSVDEWKKEQSGKIDSKDSEIKKVTEEVYNLEETLNSFIKSRNDALMEIGKFYFGYIELNKYTLEEFKERMPDLIRQFKDYRKTELNFAKELDSRKNYLEDLLEQKRLIDELKAEEDS